jgi:hypothetical protein
MARKTHVKTVRKNVSMTEATEMRMHRIRDYTNCQTDADALRLILDTYDELMTKQLDGYEVLLEPKEPSPDSKTRYFRSLFDSMAIQVHGRKHG